MVLQRVWLWSQWCLCRRWRCLAMPPVLIFLCGTNEYVFLKWKLSGKSVSVFLGSLEICIIITWGVDVAGFSLPKVWMVLQGVIHLLQYGSWNRHHTFHDPGQGKVVKNWVFKLKLSPDIRIKTRHHHDIIGCVQRHARTHSARHSETGWVWCLRVNMLSRWHCSRL